MSNLDKKIFLGKQGKIYGPFSRPEIETFQASGEIQNFVFIWDDSADQWHPLESPPPSPDGKASTRRASRWSNLKAICHDFGHLVSGTLESVSEINCEFLSEEESDYPSLGTQSFVVLNLIDPKTERSVSIEARVTAVSRRARRWSYSLAWKERPHI
jgi:hypothetical protein